MKFSNKFIRIIIILAVLVLLTANKGFRTLIIRAIEYKKINKEILELKRKNQEIEREIYLLENDESYIDYCIRKDLGYLKEGEVEYRFKLKQ
ncbi:MAG: septum formation initiator family protein [Elusimicrobiota bacterium]|nr:septum formation initiator family protein [Elusimicrobiota bacterium]